MLTAAAWLVRARAGAGRRQTDRRAGLL